MRAKMKLQEAINKRHSIREFEKKEIPKSILNRIIKNATKAPSAKNEQPWIFYVVTSKKTMLGVLNILHSYLNENKIEFNNLKSKIKKAAKSFYLDMGGAQNIIFAYREKKENPPSYQFFNDIASISCAIENLMLSAVEEGLGTCWVGTFKAKETQISKLINAPKNQELMAAIVLGYPKKGYKPLKRKKKKLKEVLKFC